ncbi:hypothetical protein COB21_03985 [Candidatus Aerophobetes bacterium]|uniref:Uncharacterized protein n=1 Tax=Aerophobetes bacterium TaxID=2030807 RepID=A0A2A4X2F9_UNCAE|nr:MAG: hypothetical protein COB21_03985 [Candidatus Aerophobetes bacterium]
MRTILLIDRFKSLLAGDIVAEVTVLDGKTTFNVRDKVFQAFLNANDLTIKGFIGDLKKRGSIQYSLVSKEDYDNPQAATQRRIQAAVAKYGGKGK